MTNETFETASFLLKENPVNIYSYSAFLVLLIISPSELLSQNKTEFISELFKIYINEKILTVENNERGEVYTKDFKNPVGYLVDLDSDGNSEFLIRDKSNSEYHLYIYILLDTFRLSSEINSGNTEPYYTSAGEIEGLIIVTGNSDFSYMKEGNEVKSLPINCWKYEDGEIFSVNEELYEIFITENESLLTTLELEEINNCDKSKQFKPFIASIYINYLNAGEKVTADNFLVTFYKCEDLKNFKDELENHYNKGNNEI